MPFDESSHAELFDSPAGASSFAGAPVGQAKVTDLPGIRTWGDAPAANRYPVLTPDGLPARFMDQCSVWDHKTAKVVLTNAGEGQAFLVAQAAWGADAAQAAQAAYGEIARVLQDQGLTIVHERLFGSLKVKAGGHGRPGRGPQRRKLSPARPHHLYPGPSALGARALPGSSSGR